MKIILKLLAGALAVFAAAYVLPGVHVKDFVAALMVALALGIVNAVLRPILVILTLPVTILTLGLFIFIINAALVLLVAAVVPGFTVDGFGWALLFSIVVSVVSWFLDAIAEAV